MYGRLRRGTRTVGTLALDHVLLAVSGGAPEIAPLIAAGFREGPPNAHPGQGTACRRFFFENAYLEFAWIENEAEVGSASISPTGLDRRLGGSQGVSRIGFCVRLPEGDATPPVKTWPYQPPYLPAGLSIPMARNSSKLDEPLLFFLSPHLIGHRHPSEHPNGARMISRVSIVLPSSVQPSDELKWLAQSGLVDMGLGSEESLRVELDGRVQGESLSMSGGSPLDIVW